MLCISRMIPSPTQKQHRQNSHDASSEGTVFRMYTLASSTRKESCTENKAERNVRKPVHAAENNGLLETPDPTQETSSASHRAVTGLVKKSDSCSAVPTFTIFKSPFLTLSCNHKKRVETCLWRPRPRLAAKPLAALESVRIFRVSLGQTPQRSINDRIPSSAAPPFTQA